MIIPPRWIPPTMHVIVILHFHCSYHGLFASTFKSTHWLATGYIIDQTWKERSLEKSTSSETPLQTRTLPSQNACRCRLDGMGTRLAPMISATSCIHVILPYRPYLVNLTILSHDVIIRYLDVRLLIFNICVFGEHWSLGSLSTYIQRSWLVSRGPHRDGIRARLTIGSLR